MVSSKLIKRDKYFLSLFSFGSEPKKLNKIFLQIASLLLPLLIWTIVCQLKLVSEMFLPSPLAVFYSLLDMAESGILFEDIFASTGDCDNYFSSFRNFNGFFPFFLCFM